MAEQKRLDENLCWEIGIVQQNKHDNTVCGDHVVVSHEHGGLQIVLSDGLGSGIQANIASTLTSVLISGLTQRGFPLEACIRSVEAVLPVTKKHRLAYATFTLVSVEAQQVRLTQYDNPPALLLRDGVSLPYPYETRSVQDKTLQESVLTMKSGDMLILFSDGVSEAGRGVTTYSGWDRPQMEDYLLRSVQPDDDARRVAASIISAVQALDLYEYHDDTTVVVLRLRERLAAHLLIGPSDAWQPDSGVLSSFFGREGLHVICGNGAAQAAASYLEVPLRIRRETITEALPPVSEIKGVDLATEGDLTFTEALEVIRRYRRDGMMSLDLGPDRDGASLLMKLLAEQASEVHILFHAGDTLPIDTGLTETDPSVKQKSEQVLQLRQLLTELGKHVTLSFC